jgi:hypothetical protein
MEAIQIQTPPKDDEIATPDASTPMDAIEVEDAPEEPEPEPESLVDIVDAEIIVKINDNEADNQNDNDDDVSSLSSAPGYDFNEEASKPGMSLRGQLTRYHQEFKTCATSG